MSALLFALLVAPFVAAPSNFVATSTVNTVALAWTYNSNANGFYLEKQLPGGVFVQIATLPSSARTYTDQNLQPSTTYGYRIRAYKGSGRSSYVYVTVTTQPAPPIPPIPIPDPCPAVLIVSNDQLIVINAQPINGLAVVQAVVDGNPFGTAFMPTPLQPFGQSWEVTPTVTGNFIIVLPTITLSNGCHTIGAFATDTTGQTGKATPLQVEVRN